MANNDRSVSAAITAQNTFTDWLILGGSYSPGQLIPFSVLVQGTGAGFTLHVQYKRPDDADADAVDDEVTFTANGLKIGELTGAYYVRAGIKTGNFGTGTVNVEVARI